MKKNNLREKILENIIRDTFWMARRYAHGRHTFSPEIIRTDYQILKEMGIKIEHDDTIKPPDENEINGFKFRNDYLDDCND